MKTLIQLVAFLIVVFALLFAFGAAVEIISK